MIRTPKERTSDARKLQKSRVWRHLSLDAIERMLLEAERDTAAAALDQHTSPPNEHGCQLWTGRVDDDGYPIARCAGRDCRAQRFAYERHRARIPDGHRVRVTCGARQCVTPEHLEVLPRLGTPAESEP